MSLFSILRTALTGSTALQALTDGRIYALSAKQGTKRPFVSYQIITDIRQPAQLDGTRVCNHIATVQIDCWANDSTIAEQMKDAVVAAIDNVETTDAADLTEINAVRWLNDDAGTVPLYRASIEAEIHYS